MKTNFAQRLTKIFEEREITQQEAADKVGVRRQAVARWLNGTSEPEREKVIALSEFLNLPPAYIMFGEEGAFDSVEIDDDTIAIPVLSVEGGCWPSGRENSVVNMVRMLRVAKEWIISRSAAANLQKLHIINAYGDSMSPLIDEGDFLIVDTSKKTIIGDGVYAIQAGEDTFIKRVQKQIDGSILLLSDNPLYKPYEVPPEEMDTLRIIGKCIIVCNAKDL